jgi:erythromycin esterase
MKLHPILRTLLVLLFSAHLAAAQGTESPALQENEKVIIAWLQQNAIPIHHIEAGNGFADLQPLKKYGDQYYAFGFDFNQGSYRARILQPDQAPGDLKEGTLAPASVGSLAWYLSRTNIGNMILDLRKPPGNPVIEHWLNTPQVVHRASWGYQEPSEVYMEVNIKKYYDGIIFFDKTTATRPTANALEAVSKGERF